MMGPLEDHRGSLARLRRPVLSAILKANNVPHTPDDPATIMRDLIAAKGIAYEGFNYEKYQEERQSKIDPPQDPIMGVDYSLMAMHQLKKLAKEAGIVIRPTEKKTEIIEKLSGQNIT